MEHNNILKDVIKVLKGMKFLDVCSMQISETSMQVVIMYKGETEVIARYDITTLWDNIKVSQVYPSSKLFTGDFNRVYVADFFIRSIYTISRDYRILEYYLTHTDTLRVESSYQDISKFPTAQKVLSLLKDATLMLPTNIMKVGLVFALDYSSNWDNYFTFMLEDDYITHTCNQIRDEITLDEVIDLANNSVIVEEVTAK